jgi:hypothetical protein
MANVLTMAAGQLSDPIPFAVLVVAHDFADVAHPHRSCHPLSYDQGHKSGMSERTLNLELLEESGAITVGMVAELDRQAGIRLYQFPKRCSPFHEQGPPRVMAIEAQEVESKEHDPGRRSVPGRSGVLPWSSCDSAIPAP